MNDNFNFENLAISNIIDDDTEFLPLLSNDDEEQINAEETPKELPLLPLRNTVLFPGVIIPITVGRDKSIKLIKEAYNGNKTLGVVAQKDDSIEDPAPKDLNKIGTIAFILKMLRMPDGNTTVIIQGKKRFKIDEFTQTAPYIKAKVTEFNQIEKPSGKSFNALVSSIKDLASQIIQQSPNIPTEATFAIKNIESPTFLINFIASNMNAGVKEKQTLLEIPELQERATLLLQHLTKELQLLELKNDIQSKVRTDLDKQQREYFLNQQIKQIQEELGGDPQQLEILEFKKKAKTKKWSKAVKERFEKELSKLERLNPQAAEYSVQSNYIETLLELPWQNYSKDNFDLKRAQRILDKDHFGLDKVKERIIEHLAVLKLKGDLKSPILCLYGPPGVGKTSLGKSVAEALGRKYVRMSLGGIRDEAEIRGHRKTYIGAMPGRIIQNLKKANSSNPVFVLDEIDKVGMSHQGDPSSALLEVLDPEQNENFYDNFLELDYDLSKILFIATANSLSSIQPALRDRMEIIEINGYTVEEKIEIANKHLIPKLLTNHGLTKKHLSLPKNVIEKVITEYTRESGVRNLEKKLAKIVRQKAKEVAMEEKSNPKVIEADLLKILGPGHSKDKYQGNDVAGVVTGLAWTSVGGDILFIETSLSKGKGKLTLTGNLGEVMKESAIIALAYLKAHAEILELKTEVFEKWDIHIHVPEGATPKDGPSAGITMLTAIASAFTQRKVKANLAMTGEITLRGRVLPVGGIKEKILAAKRADIKEIILSEDNRKDIAEIKEDYIKGVKFHYVKNMIEVIEMALMKQKVKNSIVIVEQKEIVGKL
ncbi:MAG: endopeptidase La [Flavobacteriales bacterium CG18_big_fil_WC_8_21_14_2_50_32_9]|nr:MAG: endopeptidase La [Flavobacteriales bacterium CG18_big_fil_WC_8_21_14_2_50_32_9]PJC61527.1 MAG: endopeptidase La [Flavobacteriales bacterium CG_4_9_14_0_2_um_filter_32_27]